MKGITTLVLVSLCLCYAERLERIQFVDSVPSQNKIFEKDRDTVTYDKNHLHSTEPLIIKDQIKEVITDYIRVGDMVFSGEGQDALNMFMMLFADDVEYKPSFQHNAIYSTFKQSTIPETIYRGKIVMQRVIEMTARHAYFESHTSASELSFFDIKSKEVRVRFTSIQSYNLPILSDATQKDRLKFIETEMLLARSNKRWIIKRLEILKEKDIQLL